MLILIVYRILFGLGIGIVEGFIGLGYFNSFNINFVKDSVYGIGIINIFLVDIFIVKLGIFFSKCFSWLVDYY